MNVFATHTDPFQAAAALDDKRVIKMLVESAQLLCTELHRQGIDTPYRPTHAGHPCSVWLRDHPRAQQWLLAHAYGLSAIYTAAYGRVHATLPVLDWCSDLIGKYRRPPTWWANCAQRTDLGVSFTHLDDVQLAYRHYLTERWALDTRVPTWHGRNLPDWLLTLDKENI
jgi:hypothetical protein